MVLHHLEGLQAALPSLCEADVGHLNLCNDIRNQLNTLRPILLSQGLTAVQLSDVSNRLKTHYATLTEVAPDIFPPNFYDTLATLSPNEYSNTFGLPLRRRGPPPAILPKPAMALYG